ncbi:MAG: Uma2 family endonuclease [Bryobacteraceae bacterium]
MGARLQVSPAEYLSTSFEGLDREYVHSEIVERTTPNFPHAEAQGNLFSSFRQFRESYSLFPGVELRMRLADDLYRVADVAVFEGKRPELVPRDPPLVTIEILSPDDRWSDVLEKLDEYQTWGVAHIWLVDLARQRLFVYRSGDIVAVDALRIPGYPIEIRYADITG